MGLKASPSKAIYGENVLTLTQVTTDIPLNTTLIAQLENLAIEKEWIQTVSPEVYVFCVVDDNPIVVRGVNTTAFISIEDAQLQTGEINDERTAVIGDGLSNILNVDLGGRILITGSTTPSILEVEVVGSYSSPNPSNDELLISLQAARRLAGIRDDTVMAIRVETTDSDALINYLEENEISVAVAGDATLPEVLNSNVTYDGRIINLMFEYSDVTFSQDLSLTTAFTNQGVSSVSIVVLGFIVLNGALTFVGISAILARAIVEKKRDIGILSAIGANKSKIRFILLRDILLIIIPAIVIGIALGLVLAHAIGAVNLIMVFGHSIKPVVDWLLIVEITILVIVISSVVGLIINQLVLKSKPSQLIQEIEKEAHEIDRLEDVLE
jgi:ABC-type lipoprotein release transport system permease subunit